MTPTEFCKIEDFDSLTVKELRKICSYFTGLAAYSYYFEGYSSHKDKFSLVRFLERIQIRMRIDEGLVK